MRKVKFLFDDLERKLELKNVDIVHAHTWYSDGAVAYELFKKYKIPYVVTVRSTDIDVFHKYLFHLRKYGLQILYNAQKVIFITPVLYEKLFVSIRPTHQILKDKSIIIPNGVDEFWIDNVIKERKIKPSKPVQLIYIGTFIKRKKLDNIIKAVIALNRDGKNCHLKIIGGGGGGEFENNIFKLIDNNKSFISYYGKLKKTAIKNMFCDSDIFIMPSKNETFGLVYIEALTQGIPVIYSLNDGIDGLHGKNIGMAVNGDDVDDIGRAIEVISKNYDKYDFDPMKIAKIHNWDRIASQLFSIYKEV